MQSLQISFRESVCAFYHAAGKDYVFDQLSAPGVLMLEYGVSDIPSKWFREMSVRHLIFQMILCWVFLQPEEHLDYLMFVRCWFNLTSCGHLIFRMTECR